MKVSITFDKNLKESNKKHWVKEIQTVVDRLNNKATFESSPKTSPKQYRKDEQYEEYMTPKCSYEKEKIDVTVFKQLISMQKAMEQKFDIVINSISKLADKINSVQNRISLLQAKEAQRENEKQDFNREFAQISRRYDKIRRASIASNSNSNSKFNKTMMRDTADSGFSYGSYDKTN